MKRIIILGGGAGGAVTAHRLSKRLRGEVELLLVDKSQYHEFRPSYLRVAMGVREPDDIRRPLSLLSNKCVKVVNDEVLEIDAANRMVKMKANGISYDYLVVSLGAEIKPEHLKGSEHILFLENH
ncbi:MAG: FAD-dependent oxidoreductase [Nitrososphaerales archaeon]